MELGRLPSRNPFECDGTLDLFRISYHDTSSAQQQELSPSDHSCSRRDGSGRGRLTTSLAIELYKNDMSGSAHDTEYIYKTFKTSVIWLMEPWVRLSSDSV